MSLTTTAKKFKWYIKAVFVVLMAYYVITLIIYPQLQMIAEEIEAMREPANPEYGKLEALKFIRAGLVDAKTPYILNTKDGRLPTGIPRKIAIIKFKPVLYSYLASVRAQEQATKLGFAPAELISDLKGKEFRWRSLTSGGDLTINNETGGIFLNTDLYQKGANYKRGGLDSTTARSYAKDILTSLGVYNAKQFDNAPVKIVFGSFINQRLVDTKTTAEAQLARVDFFRNIGKYPILGPNPTRSFMSVTVRPVEAENNPFNYPFVNVQFWDYILDTKVTYPIISVSEAWKQLQANNAIPVSIIPKGSNLFEQPSIPSIDKILINKIYLAYYETKEYQKYMQPIYVFEGKFSNLGTDGGDITFYFPAVASELVKPVEQIKPVVNTPQTGSDTSNSTAPSYTPPVN